jgi:hypothetical protein
MVQISLYQGQNKETLDIDEEESFAPVFRGCEYSSNQRSGIKFYLDT